MSIAVQVSIKRLCKFYYHGCAALYFSSLLLISSEAFAYRTASDLPEFQGTTRVCWQQQTVSFRLGEQTPRGVSLSQTENAIKNALRTWSDVGCGIPQLKYGGSTSQKAAPEDGVNSIEWLEDEWSEYGFSSDAPGITDVQYEKDESGIWQIIEADIYLNASDHLWDSDSRNSEDYRDLRSVLTHELGHALGLFHPCELDGEDGAPDCADDEAFAETTMYPLYSAGQVELAQDDEDGICFLYSDSSCEEEGCAIGEVCTAEGCVVQCADEICKKDESCGPLGCMTEAELEAYKAGRDAAYKSCSGDRDCDRDQICEDNICVPAEQIEDDAGDDIEKRAAGDPCARDQECQSRACTEGYCAAVCVSVFGFGSTRCLSDGKPQGETCENASECLGGECVEGAVDTPICTRLCGEGLPECPSNMGCIEVEGKNVCIPPYPVTYCNFSIAVTQSNPNNRSIWMYLSILFLTVILVRRVVKNNNRKFISPESPFSYTDCTSLAFERRVESFIGNAGARTRQTRN